MTTVKDQPQTAKNTEESKSKSPTGFSGYYSEIALRVLQQMHLPGKVKIKQDVATGKPFLSVK